MPGVWERREASPLVVIIDGFDPDKWDVHKEEIVRRVDLAGDNLLGKIITEVREKMRSKYPEEAAAICG